MATAHRVRLASLVTEGSAAGSGSRWNSELEVDEGSHHNTTLLLTEELAELAKTGGPQSGMLEGDMDSMRTFVARLEALQAQQRSPQQPNSELDDELSWALSMHPQWRQRMAVATRSATLRNKILSIPAHRAAGSAALGSTHPWRNSMSRDFKDQTWPKGELGETGPGGDRNDRFLPSPADTLRRHPLQTSSAAVSMPRTKRFPGSGNYEIDILESQKRSTPGPGSYFKTVPRGTGFSMDGGETVILGANHICPWKKCLGRNINPVHVDGTTLRSSPCFSFSKTRRSVSEVALGAHGDPGPTKTDRGCLSPGPVYEHYGSMRPRPLQQSTKRRARSSTGAPKVRMIPVNYMEDDDRSAEFYSMDCDDNSCF